MWWCLFAAVCEHRSASRSSGLAGRILTAAPLRSDRDFFVRFRTPWAAEIGSASATWVVVIETTFVSLVSLLLPAWTAPRGSATEGRAGGDGRDRPEAPTRREREVRSDVQALPFRLPMSVSAHSGRDVRTGRTPPCGSGGGIEKGNSCSSWMDISPWSPGRARVWAKESRQCSPVKGRQWW